MSQKTEERKATEEEKEESEAKDSGSEKELIIQKGESAAALKEESNLEEPEEGEDE